MAGPIILDTGAVIALMDQADIHHASLRELVRSGPPRNLVLPWAVLPEIDHLLERNAGRRVADLFVRDVAKGHYRVEFSVPADFHRIEELLARYRDLRLGLVDAVVIAIAERLRAGAIATLDYRHFGAVAVRGQPRLYPRDAPNVRERTR